MEIDFTELHEMSAELAQASASPWDPPCVARAFARRGGDALVFTMQTWIDLEAARSPLLQEDLPTENELEVFTQALAAFDIYNIIPEETSPKAAVVILEGMIAEIRESFAMGLAVRQPGAEAGEGETGLGRWLPLLAALIAQIGMSRAEALAMPVSQAFALLPAHRVNQGWEITGASYRERELEEKAETRKLKAEGSDPEPYSTFNFASVGTAGEAMSSDSVQPSTFA